ncbi:alkaline phosphatase [Alkalihalobacillus oceani]|uniref:alkaline phosphatase n=1 Tax=Halalkalibacter oceani TaxID=1653776 RepID=UPI002040B555|nr:alkaline phosphatase [Halalkalibacter oceani]MCM3762510.1 alkaline phosphatase [Halalkalibacter oceani]
MKVIKKRLKNYSSRLAKTALAAALFFSAFAGAAHADAANDRGSAKNVILLIPDGMGISYLTTTRIFKGEELSFERYVKGLMKTYSSDTNVTDSAAAGTAMATGYKTNNGMISVTPDGLEPDSILDAARESGKGTGLVATSRITHATPAVFVAHDPSRGNEVALAQDYIPNVDVILGGGRDMFMTEADGGRQPERDLIAEAIDAGYEYIEHRDQIADVTSDKVLGLFAMTDLKYEIDRDTESVPSLAEMTELAINSLSQNDEGFFLMVEGSQIDWAGHANDPIALIHDMLAFEEAFDVALEFARNDEDTLLVVVGDHETGGLNVGNTPGGYMENIQVLRNATGSSNAVTEALIDAAVQTDISYATEQNGEYYVPLREIVSSLNGELELKGRTVNLDVLGTSTTISLNGLPKTFDGPLVLDRGTTYVNVQHFAELLGLQAGIGTSEDKTTAYFVDIQAAAGPILGLDLNEDDFTTLTSVNWDQRGSLTDEVGTVVSAHALLSWGSRHHTGEELPLYAYGAGANQFVGLIDNTDLPRILSYLMDVNLFENEDEFMQKIEERRSY